MFNSVALDVVVGLIFIYLLYSLLATTVSEMIASFLGLRARNLRKAITRMLTDDKLHSRLNRLWISLGPVRLSDSELVESFYNHPEIKYLESPGRNRKPSWIRASSFARALVEVLSGEGPASAERIHAVLRSSAGSGKIPGGTDPAGPIDPETAGYLLRLWEEAEADLDRFRKLIGEWFDRTMEQASEWYRRKIRMVLMLIGFAIAWLFYADTFGIVHQLSVDKRARQDLVTLADAYARSGQDPRDTTLSVIRKRLDADLASSRSLLGRGGWLPSVVRVSWDPLTRTKTWEPALDPRCLPKSRQKLTSGEITLTFGDRITYFFRLAGYHFFGFLVTAIAISLGAPFWFDLLNRIMKLRTSPNDKKNG